MLNNGDIVLNKKYKIRDLKVIVFSGGKTASSTISKSMDALVPTLHVHNTAHLHMTNEECKKKNITIGSIINFNARRRNKLLVISIYREPISRTISSFFQNILLHTKKTQSELLEMDIVVLQNIFFEKFPFIEAYWPHLDNSTSNFGGINIFNNQFNKEKGCQIYENPYVKILMLRFDKINDFENIIKSYTKYQNFKTIQANYSGDKWYADLYEKFKNSLVIPKHLLDKMFLDSPEQKNLEYFYDKNYIDSLKDYWYNKLVSEVVVVV